MLDDKTRQVSLRVSFRKTASGEQKKISSNTIIELLSSRGFGNYFIFDELISSIAANIEQQFQQLKDAETDEDVKFETPPLAEAKDASATVEIGESNLTATLHLETAQGGKHLDIDSAMNIITESGVKHGLDEPLLTQLLNNARNAEGGGDPLSEVIAMATEAIRGEDTQFVPLVATANERILKPKVRPDGTIDMRELGDLPVVTVNQPIMKLIHSTQGTAGADVLGNPILSEHGENFDFEVNDGSCLDPNNPDQLIATNNGQPNLVHNGMQVDDVVKVKAVDLSTGNLDIDANLLVEGDITECMVVKCTGNITVGGVIESAHVEACGSITVGKGIVGHVNEKGDKDFSLSSVIIAGDRIDAVFASYSKLHAKKEVHLDEQLLHCDTTSEGCVTVGNKKTIGNQIVGGITRALTIIETDVLGSPAGVLTKLDLSAAFLEKQEEFIQHDLELTEQRLRFFELRDIYSKLTGKQLTPERKIKATKLKNTILHLNETLNKRELIGSKIAEARDEALLSAQALVKRKVNQSVEIKIGPKTFRSKRTMESGSFSFAEGDVVFNPEIV